MHDANNTDNSSLTDAYNRMLGDLREHIENHDPLQNPGFLQALDMAQKRAIQEGHINPLQADAIACIIKQDINDAAECLMETSDAFVEWLRLDINMVEQKILDRFLSAVESTRLILKNMYIQNTELAIAHNTTLEKPRAHHSSSIQSIKPHQKQLRLTCERCNKIHTHNQTVLTPLCRLCQNRLLPPPDRQR